MTPFRLSRISAWIHFQIFLSGSFCSISFNSLDYWIQNIPPRCLIKIIYFKDVESYSFVSSHNIPVMLIPLRHNQTGSEMKNDKFNSLSLKFLNPECFFSVMVYKPHPKVSNLPQHTDRMMHWLYRGFREVFARDPPHSNGTFGLMLHHDRGAHGQLYMTRIFQQLFLHTDLDLDLAIVFFSSGKPYRVYCFVNGVLLPNELTMSNKTFFMGRSFFDSCHPPQKVVYVLHADNKYKDLKREVFRKALSCIHQYQNVSEDETPTLDHYFVPTVDVGRWMFTNSFFRVFDDTARVFTCHTYPVLNFEFYYTAFDGLLWISILLSGMLVSGFLNYHLRIRLREVKSFSALLFYFSIFVEESFSIPSKIEYNRVYRIATYFWLLTAVVLTNVYISHVITGLNAPLLGKKLSNFSGLFESEGQEVLTYEQIKQHYNYTFIYHTNNYRKWYGSVLKRTVESNERQNILKGFRILSQPAGLNNSEEVWKQVHNPFSYSLHWESILSTHICERTNIFKTNYCKKVLILLTPRSLQTGSPHRRRRDWKNNEYLRSFIEEELIQCGKTLYIETSDRSEYQYLSDNYPRKNFYYLKDGLSGYPLLVGFYRFRRTKMEVFFSHILESGIVHLLHRHFSRKQHLKRRDITSDIIRRNEKIQKLDLSSSVQTVFIVYIILVSLATVQLLAEKLFCVLQALLPLYVYSSLKLFYSQIRRNFLHTYR